MSTLKRHNTKNPLKDIQKTSNINNNNNNNHNIKKSKSLNYSYTLPFVSSLNNNPHILKIACHNIVSFVNPTKQNQVIQKALLNQIDILSLSETNLSSASIKF